MRLWNKKHVKQPWHKKSRIKRVYQNRGKYHRNRTINDIQYNLNRKYAARHNNKWVVV